MKRFFYADKMTDSMQKTIDETNRRREKQAEYNAEHGIVPTQIHKSKESILTQTKVADSKYVEANAYVESEHPSVAADPVIQYMDKDKLKKLISETRRNMERVAKELDFIEAARLRDELYELEKIYDQKG